jgi:hypothetical protein
MCKAQVYFFALLGLTAAPFLMYTKYTSEPTNNGYFYAGLGGVATLFLVLPLAVYRVSTANILSNISYNTLSKQLQFQLMRKNTVRSVPPENLKLTLTKTLKVKTIEITGTSALPKEKPYNVAGVGFWKSPELFTHITENK